MWYGITFTVGIILFGIGLKFLNDRLSFLKKGEKASATVIELERSTDSDGGWVYKPVFKFSTRSKREVIYRGYFSSSPAGWRIGDVANVVYDVDDPDEVKVLTYFGTFGLPVVLLAVSLPFLLIGGGYFIAERFFKTL